jgi:ribose/xylose/arabinose/galactoside ABC-type transport system permease subunit
MTLFLIFYGLLQSINGIIAIGMTFVIICAGIDISVGSIIALASVVVGAVLTHGGNCFLAVVLAVMACGLVGVFNGFFIAKYNMFPFVVTIASQLIIRGLAYVISNGKSYILTDPVFKQIGQGRLFGKIPYSILVFASVAIICYFLLSRMKYGRYLYATGGNEHAAIASGVNVQLIKLATYTIMGICTGIAGVLLTSRVNAGQPAMGVGYETDAIAASVIGGVSFMGGIGSVEGTVIGVLIIGLINNGMNLMGVSSFYQQIVKGFIILLTVMMDLKLTNKK